MTKRIINVPNAPKLPFSPAVRVGHYIFVSGQVGYQDAKTGKELKEIDEQTKQSLDNMKEVLAAAGSGLSDVVKVTVFLKNAADFAKMNEVYRSFFAQDLPARSTVVAGFTRPEILVEIEGIAYRP